jgi:large subunit ribosomal protein L21
MMKKEEEKSNIKTKALFAVIRTGGKQYLVKEGDFLEVELMDSKENEKISFSEVLLVVNGDKVDIGKPLVEKAKVVATNLGVEKGEKQIIFKYKAKKNYRVKTGHRQKYQKLKIEKIDYK